MKTRFFNLPALVVSISLLASSGAPKLAVSAHPLSALSPTVTSVSPNQGYNYQPTTITITGSDFVATPTAQLNNVPLTNVTFVDGATLTATVPADLPGGAYTLMVTNPDSQSASLTSAFTVLMSSDGALGTWKNTTSMTTPRSYFSAVATNGYVYVLGGWSHSTVLNSIERAAINVDGSLGNWQIISSMLTSRWEHAAVVAGDYIYVLGGGTNSVERAAVNADASLGPWQYMTSMTTARDGLATVAANGYIYALGGQSSNSVERAIINPDGSLGS